MGRSAVSAGRNRPTTGAPASALATAIGIEAPAFGAAPSGIGLACFGDALDLALASKITRIGMCIGGGGATSPTPVGRSAVSAGRNRPTTGAPASALATAIGIEAPAFGAAPSGIGLACFEDVA